MKRRGDRSLRLGIFREAGLWGLRVAHLVLALAISRPVQAAFPVLAGDPVDPSTGEAYVILPGLPLILPPVGGTTVVDTTKIGDVDIVIRAGSVLGGPSIPPPASTPPIAIAGGTHVAPGTEVAFTVIASDGLATAPFGGPLLGPEMDGLPVVVFAWADLDRDGFVGPTDTDAAGATDNVREEQEALFPVGRQIGFFQNGVATGTVAIAIGAPASDGGLPVVLTAAAYVGQFVPGGQNTFFGNVPIGPAVATLFPFMPRFDPDRVVEAHGGGGRAEPSGRLGVNLEPMFDVPVGDPVLGTPFALPTDGSSPTIDRALVASGDVVRARFVRPSSPTGFPVGVPVALFPGAGDALYEALPQIDVPDDGAGSEVAARLVPVDGLDDVADPPTGFTVTLLAGPGLVIASPDLDGDPAVEVVPVASAAGLDVLVGDANGPGDSGSASTLTVLADGYPVETLAVRFTPGGGTSTTTSTTSTLTTTTVTTTTTTSTVPCPTDISFPSIRCRLDALANGLDRDVPAGSLHDALVDKLRSVRPLLDQAESLDRKRALALLKKVVRGPHFIESHLRARKAVALVPNGVRQALVASAGALASDLRALKASL